MESDDEVQKLKETVDTLKTELKNVQKTVTKTQRQLEEERWRKSRERSYKDYGALDTW